MNCLVIALSLAVPAEAPKVIDLWPDGAPGAVGKEEVDRPTLTVYALPADKANGTAIILCPGGGYFYLTGAKEGRIPAEWLNKKGVTAFVLKYRLAPRYRYPAQLHDAQRALRLVRSRAKEFHLDPKRIGICGFSAGGHLASTLATHFTSGRPDAEDPAERLSCRPDFLILGYAVITMDIAYTNLVTRRMLLGPRPSRDLVEAFSNELHISTKTPPTFLFHNNDDPLVPPENSVLFYEALRKTQVPAELHIFDQAGHGVPPLILDDGSVSTWGIRLASWLKEQKLLDPPAKRDASR
ncbi:MAG: alpha/beta hydrolase [Gemmataceae bacterium]